MLDYTPPPSHNLEPAAYVQELPKHLHRYHHRHRHAGYLPVPSAEQYTLRHHIRVARSEVTDQNLTPSIADPAATDPQIKDAFAVINQTPLAPDVKDKDIARNFRAKFAVRFAQLIEFLKQKGFHPIIGSGVRRVSTQKALTNPLKAKGPSLHEEGYAADVLDSPNDPHSQAQFFTALHKFARAARLQTVRGQSELPHVQLAHNEVDIHGFVAGVTTRHPHRKMAIASGSYVKGYQVTFRHSLSPAPSA